MSNLWSLKFGKDGTIPALVRSSTSITGNDIDFSANTVYEKLIVGNPTSPIDVVNDFQWTKSPQTSRRDTPSVRIKEKRITKNSTITNLAYSLNAALGAGGTGVDSLINSAATVQNLIPGGNALSQTSIGQNVGSIAQISSEQISETISAAQNAITELGGGAQFTSNVLKPYNGLYALEDTGFEYNLPYFDNKHSELRTQMGENQQNIASSFASAAVDIAANLASVAQALRPGTYIEESRQFQMQQEGRNINISFPLLNTGTYDDVAQNWQLIFGLVYQNRPGRITRTLVDLPVIYETIIDGVLFMPYSYISNMSVDFIGGRRKMKIPLPVTTSSDDADVGVQRVEAIIPDAYQVNITISGLNEETRNFLYESISPGLVTTSSVGGETLTEPVLGTSNVAGGPTPGYNAGGISSPDIIPLEHSNTTKAAVRNLTN
jgi:hypothetical protein